MNTSTENTQVPLPVTEPETEQQLATRQAKAQHFQQVALSFITGVRTLKVNLFMSNDAGELSQELKKALYEELLQCAAIIEVKE